MLSAKSLPSENAKTAAGKSLICMELESTLVANSRQGAGKVPDKRLACPGVCEDSEERAGAGRATRIHL